VTLSSKWVGMADLSVEAPYRRGLRGSPEGTGLAFALAGLLLVPFVLAAPLGRSLDPHSFAAFSLALTLPLTISLLRASAIRPAAFLIRAGFISLGVLLLVDVLLVWWLAPHDEGSYAAAASLARLTLLLEAPLILAVMSGVFPRDVRAALVWSMPAIGFALVAEVFPGRLVSLLFGRSYPLAGQFVRPLMAGTLLAAMTVVSVQFLIQRGRIWWVSRAVPLAVLLLPVMFLLRERPFAVAMVLLGGEALLFMAIVIPTVRTLAEAGSPREVLFMAYRDPRHPMGGGSELYVHEMARHLVGAGHAVTVCSARVEEAGASEVLDGVRYVRGGGPVTVYARAAFSYLVGRLGRPDVIIDVQNGVPFFTPLYASRPVVALVHHICGEQWRMAFPPRLARFGSWVERKVAPKMYSSVPYEAVSASTRFDLTGLGLRAEHISVVPNGTPRLPAPSRVLKSSEPSICYLGRMVPHKRIELLLEAVARLRSGFPTLTLTLVGKGWWEARLRPIVEELGIEGAVRFAGWADDQTKARILSESWVLGMPSAREGWGIAVMEGASLGVPGVAFRVGGLQESIVDGETGILADDLEGFVVAFKRLLSDGDLRDRMGHAARERALTFTWEDAGSRFLEVLRVAVRGTRVEEREPAEMALG
jgi:glycosyltransferase involved in cell wall biosynthesis